MKIRCLFYKAKWDGHLLDDAISFWTGIFNWGTGPYSHAEIWKPDEHGDFDAPYGSVHCSKPITYLGTCYTSTMRDDVNGVVKRPAAQVLRHPSRWHYAEIEISEAEFRLMTEFLEMWVERNPGYDILCIISFFMPWRWFKGEKFICSEFVYFALVYAGVFKTLRCPSPRRLSRWLVDKGYKITSLGE